MSAPIALRVLLTVAWLAALVAIARWWDVTFRFAGLLLWTCGAVVLFLLTALIRYRDATPKQRRTVWQPVSGWTALIVAALLFQAALPTLRLFGEVVQTAAIVSTLDAILPLWIFGRALFVVWEPMSGTLVVALALAGLLVLAWAYMIPMPGTAYTGPFVPLSDDERRLRDRLERHVAVLAGEIGERHAARPAALDAAARYLERELSQLGYRVERHEYAIAGQRFSNLEATLPGRVHADESVVVGAHYDSVEGAPGADDNASGAAALLELARMLRDEPLSRSVRFVAFVNEEPPYFQTAHGKPRVRRGGGPAARAHRRHAVAGVPGLLRRRARQPAVPAPVQPVLPRPRRLHRVRG